MTDDFQMIVDKRIEELLPTLGRALWEAQGCEIMLAKFYAIAAKLVGTPREKEIEAEFEKNFVHTAGRLLGFLKRDIIVDHSLVSRLDAFVVERAWLAHKVRRLNFEALKSESTFGGLMDRLEEFSTEARALIYTFDVMLMEHFVSLGADLDELKRIKGEEYERLFGS